MRWVGNVGDASRWSRTAGWLALTMCVAAAAAGAVASTSLAATSRHIALSPTFGAPGSTVTVKGSGFAASSSVTVQFDGVKSASGSTNSSGSFTLTLKVPHVPSGNHTVRAVDAKGHAASAVFRVTPIISVTPLTVTPNDALCNQIQVSTPSVVSVTASGFAAGASLNVTMGTSSVTTLTANSSGSASGKFTVPAQTAGNRTVQVTDAARGVTRRSVVFVESFTCWSATASSSGIDWAWDGVAWDAKVPVTLLLTNPNGTRSVLHRVLSGIRGGFGIYRWTGICRPAGTYPISVTGRSQGRTITIAAGHLKILRGC